jgi:hypothetical protein
MNRTDQWRKEKNVPEPVKRFRDEAQGLAEPNPK